MFKSDSYGYNPAAPKGPVGADEYNYVINTTQVSEVNGFYVNLQKQDKSLEELLQLVTLLEEKLSYVLTPESTIDDSQIKPVASMTSISPIESYTINRNEKLDRIITKLNLIIKRIAV